MPRLVHDLLLRLQHPASLLHSALHPWQHTSLRSGSDTQCTIFVEDYGSKTKLSMQRRRSVSRESLDEASEQGRGQAGAGGSAEAAQEAGSSPAGSEAVRSAMANTRTAELASLAEQADIRQGLRECACCFTFPVCEWHRTVYMCLVRHAPVGAQKV